METDTDSSTGKNASRDSFRQMISFTVWWAQLHLYVQADLRAGLVFLHGHVIASSALRGDAVTPVSISICPRYAPFVSDMIKEPPRVPLLPEPLTRCQFCTLDGP